MPISHREFSGGRSHQLFRSVLGRLHALNEFTLFLGFFVRKVKAVCSEGIKVSARKIHLAAVCGMR